MKLLNQWQWLTSLVLIAGIGFGCAPQNNLTERANQENPTTDAELFSKNQQNYQLSITDLDGRPVANAQILVGMAAGVPFAGNVVTTNAEGKALVPNLWTSAQPVTLNATGYLRATYLFMEPGNLTLRLRPTSNGNFELKGITEGFQVANRDGFVDFGFSIPALTRADLLAFSIDRVISPERDLIRVAGVEVGVPANVTLPEQSERYIVPIRLAKPQYRMSFPTLGKKTVYTASGRFPVKPVIDEMRKDDPDFLKLINQFDVQGGSLRQVELKGPSTVANLPAKELKFDGRVKVQAPSLGSNQVALLAAVGDVGGFLVPTDVKNVPSREVTQLKSLVGSPRNLLVTVIKNQDETKTGPGIDRLSATIQNLENEAVAQPLGLLSNPRLRDNWTISLPPPSSGGPEVSRLATYAVLTSIARTKDEENKVKDVATLQWEVYGPTWLAQIELPRLSVNRPGNQILRWSVALMGGAPDAEIELGPQMVDAVTHVTNTSVEF